MSALCVKSASKNGRFFVIMKSTISKQHTGDNEKAGCELLFLVTIMNERISSECS